LARPDILPGSSVVWYANFWDFLRIYLFDRFENRYCLSAENSLELHTAVPTIPRQVVVISSQGGGKVQALPYDTSLFIYADPQGLPEERITIHGIQVMTLPYALCKVSPLYFQKNGQEARIALQLIQSSSELSRVILQNNFKNASARLCGAYKALGHLQMASDIQEDLMRMGWKVKEENPFLEETPQLNVRFFRSPYIARIFALWSDYREKVISFFPKEPGIPQDPTLYLANLEKIYVEDAYHSLSIEGYHVDESLVERVRNNQWNPDLYSNDRKERDALAARGYYEAFEEVKKSLKFILQREDPGGVVERDLQRWYEALFSPLVKAEILRKGDLVGYRKGQVYIRNSRHVPLPKEALIDAMETLFECLKQEPHAAVRAVLGHYFFVYIHPYMDGNGRLGRFLMNLMFASGGYPWTIIHVEHRSRYLKSLEIAGVESRIDPLASFIAQEMEGKGP
jgi:hypothetical protein